MERIEKWKQSEIKSFNKKAKAQRYDSAMYDSDMLDKLRCPLCDSDQKRVTTVLLPRPINETAPPAIDRLPVDVGCGKRYELVCLKCDTTYDPERVVLFKRFGK